MTKSHSRQADLNLLWSLMALLEERSVSRAAERMHITQPGMSRALARLRETFDDQLLIRSGQSMVLTARALELMPQVERLLEGANRLVDPVQPELVKLRRRFKIAAVDAAIEAVLCHAVSSMTSIAPGVAFDFVNPGNHTYAQLRDGQLDLAVDVYRDAPKEFRCEQLYESKYVALVRSDHQVVTAGLKRRDFERLMHVKIVESGGGAVEIDNALRQLGVTRNIAATTSSFSAAASIVARTDWLLTLPLGPATRAKHRHAVEIIDLPFPVRPIPLAMLWHRQSDHDLGHQRLRNEILSSVANFPSLGRAH
jgi:DNA-binding transcriptional LysR family regulator